MKATFLGTGTSAGVPVIGCDCPVCTSPDPRNKRRRTSLYVETAKTCILVDTPPDFREQAIAYRLPRIDAVLFTHAHADHVFGFDDIRRYNTIQDSVIPAYASPTTMADLKRIFNYIGQEKVSGFYRPRIDFIEFDGPFRLGEVTVDPLPVVHGPKPTHGFLFQADGHALAYVPDCRELSDELVDKLRGIDVMILDALRHRPHKTHLTVEQSVGLLQRIGAGKSLIVHLCHDLAHATLQAELPDGIEVSQDGQVVEL